MGHHDGPIPELGDDDRCGDHLATATGHEGCPGDLQILTLLLHPLDRERDFYLDSLLTLARLDGYRAASGRESILALLQGGDGSESEAPDQLFVVAPEIPFEELPAGIVGGLFGTGIRPGRPGSGCRWVAGPRNREPT